MERKYAFTIRVETWTDISTEFEYKTQYGNCDLCDKAFANKARQPVRVPDDILGRSFLLTLINEHNCQETN